jgi:HD-like signal output (HDOD) protein
LYVSGAFIQLIFIGLPALIMVWLELSYIPNTTVFFCGNPMFEVDEQVLENVKRTFTIPSRPELLLELQNQLKQPQPNINVIAELISKDVGVAAGVLKLVNSAAFGLARSVTDIKQSVLFLGLTGIHSLVTGLVLKQSMSKGKCCIALDTFWDKASMVADVAVYISRRFKGKLIPEDVYTAALFQDCGIPAMALKYGDYNKVLAVAEQTVKYTLAEVEELKYKTNHAVVGYFISSTWLLPRHICQQVRLHHDKTFLDSEKQTEDQLMFAVIKMAENLVSQQHSCRQVSEWSQLKNPILDLLDLDEYDYLDIVDDVEQMLEG